MADRTHFWADPRRRLWMLAGAGLVALVLLVVSCAVWFPKWLYPSMTASDLRGVTAPAEIQGLKAERLKLQNDARTTLFQGLAAVLVLAGAGLGATVTLRQLRTTHTQIVETAAASANQAKLSAQGPGH